MDSDRQHDAKVIRERVNQTFLKKNAIEVEFNVDELWQVRGAIERVERALGLESGNAKLGITVTVTPYVRFSDVELRRVREDLFAEGFECAYRTPEDESDIELPEAA